MGNVPLQKRFQNHSFDFVNFNETRYFIRAMLSFMSKSKNGEKWQ